MKRCSGVLVSPAPDFSNDDERRTDQQQYEERVTEHHRAVVQIPELLVFGVIRTLIQTDVAGNVLGFRIRYGEFRYYSMIALDFCTRRDMLRT